MTPYDHEWAMMNKKVKVPIKSKKLTSKKLTSKELGGACTRCGSTENLTKDHIIPLAILRAMGLETTNTFNLQPMCQKCNLTKGCLLDPKNPKTIPLLQMYIDRWQNLYQVPRKKNVYVFRNLKVKHDTTVYKFGVLNPIEDLKDIYRKQSMRATWRV